MESKDYGHVRESELGHKQINESLYLGKEINRNRRQGNASKKKL